MEALSGNTRGQIISFPAQQSMLRRQEAQNCKERKMSKPVVLITGALTGIGHATAIAFAKQGARVVVSGRRDKEGKELVEALRGLGDLALLEGKAEVAAQSYEQILAVDPADAGALTKAQDQLSDLPTDPRLGTWDPHWGEGR